MFVLFGERFTEQGGKKEYLISLAIRLSTAILSTHILRKIIKKTNWLKFAFNKILVLFIVGVTVTSLFLFYGANAIEHVTKFSYDNFIRQQRLEKAKIAEKKAGLESVAYYKSSPLKDSLTIKTITEIKKSTNWYKNNKGEWQYEDRSDLAGVYQVFILIGLWLLIYIV